MPAGGAGLPGCGAGGEGGHLVCVAEAVSERCLRVVQVVGCALCVRVGGHEVTCLGHVAQQRQPGLIT